MSIKEALQRTPGGVLMTFDGRQIDQLRKQDSWEALRIGKGILGASGVTALLDELAEIIRLDFPDVQTVNVLRHQNPYSLDYRFELEGTAVITRIGWDYREETPERTFHSGDNAEGEFTWTEQAVYSLNCVEIYAFPHTGILLVKLWTANGESGVWIPRDVWSLPEGRPALEDAIALAYNNPFPYTTEIVDL